MHHDIKKFALDQVGQEPFFMAMEERYPGSPVLGLEKSTLNADIPGLFASLLKEVVVAIIVPVYPYHLTVKGSEHRDDEWRDKITGMEKDLLCFTIQAGHRSFQLRDIVMGIAKNTYLQRDVDLSSCVDAWHVKWFRSTRSLFALLFSGYR